MKVEYKKEEEKEVQPLESPSDEACYLLGQNRMQL